MFKKKVYFQIAFKSFHGQYWLNWNLSVLRWHICHLFGYPYSVISIAMNIMAKRSYADASLLRNYH